MNNYSHRKRHGVVYTPPEIVALILDNALPREAGELAGVSVCDPACGAGAFLAGVAHRLLGRLNRDAALAALGRMAGYDIDREAISQCRARLDDVLAQYYPGARVEWDLKVRNALDRESFAGDRGRFTHIVGNPPYVRVQHLERWGRGRIAGQWDVVRGATDLYLVFYELGLELLRAGGALGYITPSGWLRSDAGAGLRRMLATGHQVRRLLDFGEHQVFADATTYTAITIIVKEGVPGDIPVSKYDGAEWRDGGYASLERGQPGRRLGSGNPVGTGTDAGTGKARAQAGGGCRYTRGDTDAGGPGVYPAGRGR